MREIVCERSQTNHGGLRNIDTRTHCRLRKPPSSLHQTDIDNNSLTKSLSQTLKMTRISVESFCGLSKKKRQLSIKSAQNIPNGKERQNSKNAQWSSPGTFNEELMMKSRVAGRSLLKVANFVKIGFPPVMPSDLIVTKDPEKCREARPEQSYDTESALKSPKQKAPPKPNDCDGLDPDSYLRMLIEAQTGQIVEARKASSLPESFFSAFTDEQVASYDNAIVSAVRENAFDDVRKMHSNGRDLSCCNRFGESLLHMACRRGYIDMVSFLTGEAKGDIRIKDDCGRTPFHDACWNHTPVLEILDGLIEKDGPCLFLVADKRGSTPFQYARREHWSLWRNFLYERRIKLDLHKKDLELFRKQI